MARLHNFGTVNLDTLPTMRQQHLRQRDRISHELRALAARREIVAADLATATEAPARQGLTVALGGIDREIEAARSIDRDQAEAIAELDERLTVQHQAASDDQHRRELTEKIDALIARPGTEGEREAAIAARGRVAAA